MPTRARPRWLQGLPRGEPRASEAAGSRTCSCLLCPRVGGRRRRCRVDARQGGARTLRRGR
eukprot:3313493-Pleurochrysis_carterae.AAC.1